MLEGGGPYRDGGRAYFSSYIFEEIHINFQNFTIAPLAMTKIKQELVIYCRHFTNATLTCLKTNFQYKLAETHRLLLKRHLHRPDGKYNLYADPSLLPGILTLTPRGYR